MTITGPDARSAAPGQAVVDAAMLVLERMGLTPADLLATPAPRPPAPTFAEYIPVVSALVSDGCDPGQVRSSRRDHDGPAGPHRQGGDSNPVRHRPGTHGRQQAHASRKASIPTGPAQRGNQGLQPGHERPGAHNQCRAGGHSNCPGRPQQCRGANLILRR